MDCATDISDIGGTLNVEPTDSLTMLIIDDSDDTSWLRVLAPDDSNGVENSLPPLIDKRLVNIPVIGKAIPGNFIATLVLGLFFALSSSSNGIY